MKGQIIMDEVYEIKICKVCDHYVKGNNGFCKTLGNYQVINVANGCPYFAGEKYKFNRTKAQTIGERPSTFSK